MIPSDTKSAELPDGSIFEIEKPAARTELLSAMQSAGRLIVGHVGDSAPKQLAIAIQCKETRTGIVGDYAFRTDGNRNAVSPIFDDLTQLFAWLKENGYSADPHSSSFPCGLYSRKQS
jgi:hypothetical protein